MSKDPAFLFYPNDFMGGTMGMTFEEKGAYIDLLILQFNRGHMTEHMIGQTVGQLWVKLKDKFLVDEQGKYYNLRLDFEKDKRIKYSNSRRNNVLGANQYKKSEGHMNKDMNIHMIGHMENENENINITKKKVDIIYWETEKKSFLNAGDWIYKFCTDKSISLEYFDKNVKEFINDIELKEDFKEVKELKRHFTNWFNLKSKKNGLIEIENAAKPIKGKIFN